MPKYKFNNEHVSWMKEQVWESKDNIDIYSYLSEFELKQTSQFLPAKPKVIMDIGCGLGRSAVSLNWHYNDPEILFILADRQGRTENQGIFFPSTDEYYNDFEAMSSFVRLNGLNNFITFDTEKGDWKSLPAIDLVTSRCACGFHFPISRYMDRLYATSAPEITMVFGVNQYYKTLDKGTELFGDLFQETMLVSGERDDKFPTQNWLVLKNKI